MHSFQEHRHAREAGPADTNYLSQQSLTAVACQACLLPAANSTEGEASTDTLHWTLGSILALLLSTGSHTQAGRYEVIQADRHKVNQAGIKSVKPADTQGYSQVESWQVER